MAEKPSLGVEVGSKYSSECTKSISSLQNRSELGLFSLAKSPINIENLRSELNGYDQDKATAIFNGFAFGFPLYYSGERSPSESKNLKSANLLPEVVRRKIKGEIDAGRVAGPFDYRPFPTLRVSPLGLVPKKEPGDYRLIHHLSYPSGDSVNDFIDPQLCSVQYTSFDEAIHMVQDLGVGCLLGKSDIKSAFRLLPVSVLDFDQLGFKFDGKYYFDKSMPFGCSIACQTWELFATFLEFCVARQATVGKLLHYLDDFLFGGKRGTDQCASIMAVFQGKMTLLGVPVASEKTEGPSTKICFLGLEIDSEEMVIRIPRGKIIEITQKIEEILPREKCTLKQMQSLIGSLNFACRAVTPGRPFCRRLINATCGLSKQHHHLRITADMKKDLKLWLHFFKDFNGISVFHDRFWTSNEDIQLFTDSAGGVSLGFGASFARKWAYGAWPHSWVDLGITEDITVLELFPLLVSLHIWGEELRNKKILFRVDNLAVVHIVNSMTSKSDRVMTILRAFTLQCLHLNLVVKAQHVSSSSNSVADALSRFQFQRFHQLVPDAEPFPTPVPNHLWSIFS
ncbi:MAG: reverse transcriptase domain-containing protein [Candidatus Thiodiazotropha sp.]